MFSRSVSIAVADPSVLAVADLPKPFASLEFPAKSFLHQRQDADRRQPFAWLSDTNVQATSEVDWQEPAKEHLAAGHFGQVRLAAEHQLLDREAVHLRLVLGPAALVGDL